MRRRQAKKRAFFKAFFIGYIAKNKNLKYLLV